MTLLFISFIAGALTALAPCILPLLPVVIGGSVAGKPSLKRAAVITASLALSVFVFTFILKVSTVFLAVPPSFWQWLSGGVLFIVGVFMFFPDIWDSIAPAALNLRGNRLMAKGERRGGIGGDILIGAALGPIFSSCSPTYFVLLAAVLPAHPEQGFAYLLAYVTGLALALLLIAFLGQRIMDGLGLAADPRGIVKRTVGALFVLLGIGIIFGADKALQQALPSWTFGATNLEQALLEDSHAVGATTTPALGGEAPATEPAPPLTTLAKKASMYQKAPELVSPDAYLNTDGTPLTLASLKGKVVLLDFWTYSCINCQRTLPYLKAWYAKYKDQGLVVLGVHTPEFAFEHLKENVANALREFGLTYPVVLDNEYQTWNAYGNAYWPHEYVIDMDGYIVHDHIGEGEYDVTEKAIQAALAERAARLKTDALAATSTVSIAPTDLSGVGSPETYFGAARNKYLGNGAPGKAGTQTLVLPLSPEGNTLYLGGTWDVRDQYAANSSAGALVLYAYKAANVYFVASGMPEGTQVEIYQDGKLVGSAAGTDVKDGIVTISESRLYHLIHNPESEIHVLKLIVRQPGLKAYTFTFG